MEAFFKHKGGTVMKKIIATITAAVLVLTMCTTALASSFADLNDARWDWARDTIVELAQKGIVKGYSDGTYQPVNSVTNQEAFTLFARTIGVNDDANKDAVEAAQELYASVAQKYNTYAVRELCFMLYRGIFTPEELDTYLSEETKNEPMKRHEAAILITKIMGGQKEVENTVVYVFDYTDADEIPAASKGYIDFVTKQGIMRGMEDNTFSPNTAVTRAQVAIMLKNTMSIMNMAVSGGVLTSVDADAKTIVLNGKTFNVLDSTMINIDGKHESLDKLRGGDEVIATFNHKGLWAIDAIKSPVVSTTVEAIFAGSATDTRGTFIKAYDRSEGASAVKEYTLGDNVEYIYNGAISILSNLRAEDRVYLTLEDDVVVKVVAESKKRTITDARAKQTVLDPVPALEITHASSEYDGKIYEVANKVSVTKNKKTSNFRSILPGDMLLIELEYDTIVSITATSQLSSSEGTIEEIKIAQNGSSITLSEDGKTNSYAIVHDTDIYIDGTEASIYDLRLGYFVVVNTESDTVTKLDVRSVAQSKSITGTVSLINVSLEFINLTVTDATGTRTQQVFVKDGASIITSSTTSRKTLADIKVGDTLMITGESNIGAFEASTIIIVQ